MPPPRAVDTRSGATHGSAVVSHTHRRPAMRGHGPCPRGAPATPVRWAAHATTVLSSMPYVHTRAGCCAPSTLRPAPRSRAACHATDDPTAAARPLALRRPPRDTLQPLIPPRAARRARAPRVAHRRRLVGATGRRTHRLTSPLNHDFPPALPGCEDQDPTRFGACRTPWPPLQAAQRARRTTLERCFHAPHVRDPHGIAPRLQAIKHARPLTPAAGVIAPQALFVQALVTQLRARRHALADCDQAMAQHAQRPPAFPLGAARPGAGAVLAPRLLVACGAPRARAAAAAARQPYAGLAPVTERRRHTTWVHWRWPGPTCRRHTGVAWAAASIRQACWARLSDPQPRDPGASQQAAVRARAFTWRRRLLRCWQERPPDADSVSRKALTHRGSPRLRHLAQ
jgi:hypothetical protein